MVSDGVDPLDEGRATRKVPELALCDVNMKQVATVGMFLIAGYLSPPVNGISSLGLKSVFLYCFFDDIDLFIGQAEEIVDYFVD